MHHILGNKSKFRLWLIKKGICRYIKEIYIVYMGNLDERHDSPSLHHFNILQDIGIRSVRQSLVRSYTRSFNGFAAYLTAQEQEKLADHEKVVSVFPSTTFRPQTTRSWDFLGLTEKVHRNPTIESDIIIGVIDTGIWPESESFNDKGLGPPPKKWKGVCKGGRNFTCNKKIIGARSYNSKPSTDISARDTVGHGTHTASIAAGNYVKDASFYGIAKGTARGGVPSSRIAAYKACRHSGCVTEDILAAFDDAIADGVDIITISIGGDRASKFDNDPIAIGSLHAEQKAILVVQSAGNEGNRRSISSIAPWIFSVAASSTDRGIISKVTLGNGMIFTGTSVNSFNLNGTTFPLVYGKDVSALCDEVSAQSCVTECLDSDLVKGKIVLCDEFDGINEAFRAGALGSIALDEGIGDISFVVPLPASALHGQNFFTAQSYVNSTKAPKVDILASESIHNLDTPRVASFSSRGPNTIIPDILKPDVTAPGIEILAAFSPKASPSENLYDERSVNYNILSGSSMACPHVAGAAAYVKSLHPDWSPSAIKSALMTTAWKMNATKDTDAEFAYGSGHIDPVKAANPGLVYETMQEDYVQLLCGLGYDTPSIRRVFGGNISCSNGLKMKPNNLNYPSMTISTKTTPGDKGITFSETLRRTVTNVGSANSTYKAITSKSSDYNVTVNPSILTFEALNEVKSFEVLVSGKINGDMISAALEWSDGVHNVRSPIVVYNSDEESLNL